MPVIQLPATALRLGAPVPFALRDASGMLLVPRGGKVETPTQLQQLIDRGIYVDVVESQQFKRAMATRVDTLLRSNARLGSIADDAVEPARPAPTPVAASPIHVAPEPASSPLLPPAPPRRRIADPVNVLNGLLLRTSALLQGVGEDFIERVTRLDAELLDLLDSDPDSMLLMLVHTCTSETHQYSVSHALLVAAVCELAARHVVSWPEDRRVSLRRAALTMNIAVTELQNQLVHQDAPLSIRQREIIDGHAAKGVAMMRHAGVDDELWLQAVEQHHASPPGPLAELSAPLQLARLIQRADIFAARLSPREARNALSASAAARFAYLDENKRADEAGAAIIKALGIHPPGSFVRLANAEVCVVLRRGRRANEPIVAVIIGKSGNPTGEPAVRDTRLKAFEVVAGVAPHEIRLRLNLAKLLNLS